MQGEGPKQQQDTWVHVHSYLNVAFNFVSALENESNCFCQIRWTIAVQLRFCCYPVLRLLIFASLHITDDIQPSRKRLLTEHSPLYAFRVCPMCIGQVVSFIYSYLQEEAESAYVRRSGKTSRQFQLVSFWCTSLNFRFKFEFIHLDFSSSSFFFSYFEKFQTFEKLESWKFKRNEKQRYQLEKTEKKKSRRKKKNKAKTFNGISKVEKHVPWSF